MAWGHNNGHIAHCAAIGREAARRGWRAVIAHDGNVLHSRLVEECGCESVRYPPALVPAEMWHSWRDEPYLRAAVGADLDLIDKYSPSVVVHDVRMSTPIAACAARIACMSVCHQPLLPGFAYPELGVSELWLRGIAEFNKVLASFGQQPIAGDLRELLVRGLVLIPSVPELDPPLDTVPHESLRYVGPLTAPAPHGVDVPDRLERDAVFFYRTVGPNASLPEFCEAFADLGDRVFIATGAEDSARELRERCAPYGFRIRAFWSMAAVGAQASVAVHHGGPGMSLSCLDGGMSSLIIPGDSPERGLYGSRISSLGVGMTLSAGASFSSSWHSAVDLTGPPTSWSHIRALTTRLHDDAEVRARVEAWRTRLAELGPHLAVDALDSAARAGQ